MTEDFNVNTGGPQPKPVSSKPAPFDYNNLYDALKTKKSPFDQEGVSIKGKVYTTPKALEDFLKNEKNQADFYNEYSSNSSLKRFGITDQEDFKTKLSSGKEFAWTPSKTNVTKSDNLGVTDFDPSQRIKEKQAADFAKIAAIGKNINPVTGVELTTPEEFKEFTTDPNFDKYINENRLDFIKKGVDPDGVKQTFQEKADEKVSGVSDFNYQVEDSNLINTINAEYAITADDIGMIADNEMMDPTYRFEKTQTVEGFGENKYSIGIAQIFTVAKNLGYTDEQATDFVNRSREQYRSKKFKQIDLEKNAQATSGQMAGPAGAAKNTYQLESDQKGFAMLSESSKAIAKEYEKLDTINKNLKGLGPFDENRQKFQAELDATNAKISQLKKDADKAAFEIYDPASRTAIDEQTKTQVVQKARSKYNEQYYNNTLLSQMKQQRNALFLETEELKSQIIKENENIDSALSRGITSPSEEAVVSLAANTKLYAEKMAELYVLNEGIYTNSNPLKRDSRGFVSGVSQYTKKTTFGGLKKSTQGLTYAEEASKFAEFMTERGFYVSERDMESTQMGTMETVGYGFLPTLGFMAEMAITSAVTEGVGGAITASRYYTAAREFVKNSRGVNSAALKMFDVFVGGGIKTAAQVSSYALADQSVAGGLGEITAESAVEKIIPVNKLGGATKGLGKGIYILTKYLSGAGGETLAETAGNLSDLWANEGYSFKEAFDIATDDKQMAVVGISSLILTAPGDIRLLVKSEQKMAQYIASKRGQSVDPMVIEVHRMITETIDNHKANKNQAPKFEELQEPVIDAQPVPMGEGPVEEPGVSEIPQEKIEEVKKQEKLQVEQRIADVGEEFHVVENDGEVEKNVTYRYNEKTGKLESKGYTEFNSDWKEVNDNLKAEVERKSGENGIISSTKAFEIAKENLGIDENTKLVYRDGKFLYSRDAVNKISEDNSNSVKNSSGTIIQRIKKKREKVDNEVFSDTDKVNTSDNKFNSFANIVKGAFSGRLRLDLGSVFFDGAKINTDAQRGGARVSNYMAPLMDKFFAIGNNNTMLTKAVSSIVSSKYFKEAFIQQEMDYLENEGLVEDAAKTLLANMLINDDASIDLAFDGDMDKSASVKRIREGLNSFVAKEYTGTETSASYTFYNTKMSDIKAGLSETEASLKGKEFKVAQEERRQIQNVAKTATGKEYNAEEVGSIRYMQGKIDAKDFLGIVGEDITGLDDAQVETLAKQKADQIGVYDAFSEYKEKYDSFTSTRKNRIARIKKDALDKAFDFKIYGKEAARRSDNPILATLKNNVLIPRKLRRQKDYAAKLMNAMIEFASLRAGIDPDAFLENVVQFEKITQAELTAAIQQTLQSQQGRVALQATVKNDPSLRNGEAFGNKALSDLDQERGIDSDISYFARGWYADTNGVTFYGEGHPFEPQLSEDFRFGEKSEYTLAELLSADKMFEMLPGLQNKKVVINREKGETNYATTKGDTITVTLPTDADSEMVKYTVMSEVRKMAAKEAGLPVEYKQSLNYDDLVDSMFSEESEVNTKIKELIERVKPSDKRSGLEQLFDYASSPGAFRNEITQELDADPVLKNTIISAHTRLLAVRTAEKYFGDDLRFIYNPEAFTSSLDMSSLTVNTITDQRTFIIDTVGLLELFSQSNVVSEIQSEKIIDFAFNVLKEYRAGSTTLSNIGLYDLMKEVNSPAFDQLVTELSFFENTISYNIYFEAERESNKEDKRIFDSYKSRLNYNLEESVSNNLSQVSEGMQTYENWNNAKSKGDSNISDIYSDIIFTRLDLKNQYREQVNAALDTNSPEFKKFFGNSVVVDDKGNPLVLFRGARDFDIIGGNSRFSTNIPSKAFSYTKTESQIGTGSNVIQLYARIENPLVIDAKGGYWDKLEFNDEFLSTDSIVTSVRNGVYPKELVKDPSKKPDGVIFKNIIDYGGKTEVKYKVPLVNFKPGDVYVPFSDSQYLLKDVTLFQEDSTIRAAVNLKEDGTAIIYAVTNPNVSSPIHELAHVLENYLTDEEKATVLEFSGQTDWNTDASEAFARGFERYLFEGVSPNRQMTAVFDKFKLWLTEIYNALGLGNLGKELNPQMRTIYKTIFGQGAEEQVVVDEDQDIYEFIQDQKDAGIPEEDIYYGLIKSGFSPQDVSEYFNLRTKETVAKLVEDEESDLRGAAVAIREDAVTVKRTLEDIIGILNQMDPADKKVLMGELSSMADVGDIALVARIQKMQELAAMGMDVTKDLEEIAQAGTNAGRMLQRMKMIQRQTGEFQLANLIKQYNKRDRSIPDKSMKALKTLAKDMDNKKADYDNAKDQATKYPLQTSTKDPSKTNLEYMLDAKDKYENARFEFFKALKPFARSQSFSDLYDTLVRGNLLTFGSFGINLTSNAVKAILNIPLNIVASGIGAVRYKFSKVKSTYRDIGYYKAIASSTKLASQQAVKAFTQGSVVEDANGLQIARGFNGIRAFRDMIGMMWDYATSNMTQEELADKYNFPLDKTKKIPTKDKILRSFEGTFGFVAEANFRFLGGPDAFFRTTAYFGALYEQARAKGLSNEPSPKLGGMSEQELFMIINSDFSNKEAMNEAMRFIYANDGLLYKTLSRLFTLGGKADTFAGKLAKSSATTVVPFAKIPANVAEEFLQFADPSVSTVVSAYNYRKAKMLDKEIKAAKIPSQKAKLRNEQKQAYRDADLALSRGLVGVALQYLSIEMITQYAISGSASPAAGVDEKERNWKKEFMPADHINLTLLFENLGKEDSKKRKVWKSDDNIKELRLFGVFGAIMSMKKTEIEKANRSNRTFDLGAISRKINADEQTGELSLINTGKVVPYLLDQTMVKNLGDAFNALNDFKKDEGTKTAVDFVASLGTTAITAFAPNHLNTITKFFREFETSYKSTPEERETYNFGELTWSVLKNRLKEKVPFVFDDNYRYQYDVTGKPLRRTEQALDPIAEFFGLPIPKRGKRLLSGESEGFEFAKTIYEKIEEGNATNLTWRDVIYLAFAYGDVKEVIPKDVPKSISTELGFSKALSEQEVAEYRRQRNAKRDVLVEQVIAKLNEKGAFGKLLNMNSSVNRREDGTRITIGEKNTLLGYQIVGDIMNELYTSIDNIINTTYGYKVVSDKLATLTPEEMAVIDKISKENVYGAFVDKIYKNKELMNRLNEANINIENVLQEMSGEAKPVEDVPIGGETPIGGEEVIGGGEAI